MLIRMSCALSRPVDSPLVKGASLIGVEDLRAPVAANGVAHCIQTERVRDLVRVNVVLLRQLGQRLVALQRRQRHLRLECRRVVPPRPSRHALAPVMAAPAAVGGGKASTYPAVRISGATSDKKFSPLALGG